MPLLTIGEAAARLHTTPSTIRSWEKRLGYPMPSRSGSGRRLYDESVIALLGDALARGLSISSAVRLIREETGSHTDQLRSELAALRFADCDRLLEAAVTMRGVGRAFDEIVMEAVDDLAERSDNAGVLALAVGWASDHALSYRRLATTPVQATVVVSDSSVEAGALRAASDNLRLQLRFRGFATHTLRGSAALELGTVARLVKASAVLFVGDPPEALGKAPAIGVPTAAAFRGQRAVRGGSVTQLPSRPRLAAEELLSLVRRAAEAHEAAAHAAG
ncbi:MAG TPA: MerR family DNA-binding transcriptional regulator [Solirubrobacteraceae bacterium]